MSKHIHYVYVSDELLSVHADECVKVKKTTTKKQSESVISSPGPLERRVTADQYEAVDDNELVYRSHRLDEWFDKSTYYVDH